MNKFIDILDKIVKAIYERIFGLCEIIVSIILLCITIVLIIILCVPSLLIFGKDDCDFLLKILTQNKNDLYGE